MVAARRGGDHLSAQRGRVLPDAGFYLETASGPIECYLEWDRATETQERLAEKLRAYRRAEAHLYSDGVEPRCILFVVPGPRRLETLRRAYGDFERGRERRASRGSTSSLDGRWPLLATMTIRLRTSGPLGAVWERLERETARLLAPADLPVRGDLKPVGVSRTLGRRWRKDDPDFWRRLSPLGACRASPSAEEDWEVTPQPGDAEDAAFIARLRRLREADLEEARRDAAALGSAKPGQDLRSSAINGSMDDREDDVEEERWR